VALELLKEVEVDIEGRVTAPFRAASVMGGRGAPGRKPAGFAT
jgi:hypothetical protein